MNTCFGRTGSLLFEVSWCKLLSTFSTYMIHSETVLRKALVDYYILTNIFTCFIGLSDLKDKISITSSGVLRTIFRLCPLCTYMPPSKLVDVLRWETHSSPTLPKAPSTPILVEIPTNALMEQPQNKRTVSILEYI